MTPRGFIAFLQRVGERNGVPRRWISVMTHDTGRMCVIHLALAELLLEARQRFRREIEVGG